MEWTDQAVMDFRLTYNFWRWSEKTGCNSKNSYYRSKELGRMFCSCACCEYFLDEEYKNSTERDSVSEKELHSCDSCFLFQEKLCFIFPSFEDSITYNLCYWKWRNLLRRSVENKERISRLAGKIADSIQRFLIRENIMSEKGKWLR